MTTIDEHILNVRPDPVDFRDLYFEPGLVELPTWVDPMPLADMGLVVRNQGSEGSCTGQALAAVVDIQNIVRFDDGADVPPRVSARMLYEMARAYDEFPDDDMEGSSARGAIKALFHNGVCGSHLAPYFPGDIDWLLTPEQSKDARRVGLGAYFRLRHVLNDCHSALVEGKSLYCTAQIHSGWTNEAVAQNGGRIVMPHSMTPSEMLGGHAFAIVGYDSEGFIVLNSWGHRWGGFKTARGKALSGMAHWSYQDWRQHVMDTWVLRLQVPSGLPSGFVGGWEPGAYTRDVSNETQTTEVSSGVTGAARGHLMHVDDGRLVTSGRYRNSLKTFQETAKFLVSNEQAAPDDRYNHLLFYAHGGLNDLDDAVLRAVRMSGVLKQNGIYPIFFAWRTGLKNIIGDILRSKLDVVLQRSGGLLDLTDKLLEKASRPVGRPVWSEMKRDASLAFDRKVGEAWTATRILIEAAQARVEHPLKVHFVGHSAGAIFLAHIFERARREQFRILTPDSTMNLFAPAITWNLFNKTLAPVARDMKPDMLFSIYNLTDQAERDDSVAEIYRKSLLYLVSRAFENERKMPIVGMDRFWRDHRKPRKIAYYLAGRNYGPQPVSMSKTHGGFDEDPLTLNHVLARIVKEARGPGIPGSFE